MTIKIFQILPRAALALALLASVAPAEELAAERKRRIRNWRLKPKAPASSPARPAKSTAAAETPAAPARPKGPSLLPGKWTPAAREALEGFLAERGKGAREYDPNRPPVAVLPWSDAAVAGDPAELVFLRLVTRADLKVDDAFWAIVPVEHGRREARVAYDQFIALSSGTWTAQPAYHQYRKAMLAGYLGLCGAVGRRECRSYLARLWTGWRPEEVEEYARRALAEEKSRPSGVELVRSEEGDPKPLKVRRGLRLLPHVRDLVAKLRAEGVDVWVIDDVPQPVLEAAAADYGVDRTRVIGIRGSMDSSRLGAGVLKPLPLRGGKLELLRAAVGRPPDLVIGRDAADSDLLDHGEGVRLVLSGDPVLEKLAAERGWPVQPAFVR